MASAPRATGAHLSLALSPSEQAAVAAELAGLSARVANLAARLDRLQTALAPVSHATARPATTTPHGNVARGLATASETGPWQ